MPARSFRSGARSLWENARAHWQFKLALTFALNLFFWLGYGFLSHHAFLPLHTLPLTPLDHAIPFEPRGWSWVYMSEFIFTAATPWLISQREMLHRYAKGVGLLS